MQSNLCAGHATHRRERCCIFLASRTELARQEWLCNCGETWEKEKVAEAGNGYHVLFGTASNFASVATCIKCLPPHMDAPVSILVATY
jgi:hypothetical protein